MKRIKCISFAILVGLIYLNTSLLSAQKRYLKIPRIRVNIETTSRFCKSTDLEVKLYQDAPVHANDHGQMVSKSMELQEQILDVAIDDKHIVEMHENDLPYKETTSKSPLILTQRLFQIKNLKSGKYPLPKYTNMDFDELFMVGWIAAGAFITFAAAAVINFIIGGFSIIVIAMIIAAGVFFLAAVIFFILAYTIGEEDYF